jgi:hypothetical protein
MERRGTENPDRFAKTEHLGMGTKRKVKHGAAAMAKPSD